MVKANVNKRAVIDLGTNTFNLLIGSFEQGRFTQIHSEKLPVLLGMGGINEQIISEAAMHRAKDALRKFKKAADIEGVESLYGIGTSALRDASNGQELLDFAREELAIDIQIISGEEEAQLIYEGVRLTHSCDPSALIMDIGGGSTEFIVVRDHQLDSLASFDIGVSRLYQLLDQPAMFTEVHRRMIEDYIAERAGNFFDTLHTELLIGSSGSFETLYEMIYQERFPDYGEAVAIDMEKLMPALEHVIHSTLEERLHNEWIVPIRKKMLPISAIKIKWVIDNVQPNQVFVSPYSLKEGALARG